MHPVYWEKVADLRPPVDEAQLQVVIDRYAGTSLWPLTKPLKAEDVVEIIIAMRLFKNNAPASAFPAVMKIIDPPLEISRVAEQYERFRDGVIAKMNNMLIQFRSKERAHKADVRTRVTAEIAKALEGQLEGRTLVKKNAAKMSGILIAQAPKERVLELALKYGIVKDAKRDRDHSPAVIAVRREAPAAASKKIKDLRARVAAVAREVVGVE